MVVSQCRLYAAWEVERSGGCQNRVFRSPLGPVVAISVGGCCCCYCAFLLRAVRDGAVVGQPRTHARRRNAVLSASCVCVLIIVVH